MQKLNQPSFHSTKPNQFGKINSKSLEGRMGQPYISNTFQKQNFINHQKGSSRSKPNLNNNMDRNIHNFGRGQNIPSPSFGIRHSFQSQTNLQENAKKSGFMSKSKFNNSEIIFPGNQKMKSKSMNCINKYSVKINMNQNNFTNFAINESFQYINNNLNHHSKNQLHLSKRNNFGNRKINMNSLSKTLNQEYQKKKINNKRNFDFFSQIKSKKIERNEKKIGNFISKKYSQKFILPYKNPKNNNKTNEKEIQSKKENNIDINNSQTVFSSMTNNLLSNFRHKNDSSKTKSLTNNFHFLNLKSSKRRSSNLNKINKKNIIEAAVDRKNNRFSIYDVSEHQEQEEDENDDEEDFNKKKSKSQIIHSKSKKSEQTQGNNKLSKSLIFIENNLNDIINNIGNFNDDGMNIESSLHDSKHEKRVNLLNQSIDDLQNKKRIFQISDKIDQKNKKQEFKKRKIHTSLKKNSENQNIQFVKEYKNNSNMVFKKKKDFNLINRKNKFHFQTLPSLSMAPKKKKINTSLNKSLSNSENIEYQMWDNHRSNSRFTHRKKQYEYELVDHTYGNASKEKKIESFSKKPKLKKIKKTKKKCSKKEPQKKKKSSKSKLKKDKPKKKVKIIKRTTKVTKYINMKNGKKKKKSVIITTTKEKKDLKNRITKCFQNKIENPQSKENLVKHIRTSIFFNNDGSVKTFSKEELNDSSKNKINSSQIQDSLYTNKNSKLMLSPINEVKNQSKEKKKTKKTLSIIPIRSEENFYDFKKKSKPVKIKTKKLKSNQSCLKSSLKDKFSNKVDSFNNSQPIRMSSLLFSKAESFQRNNKCSISPSIIKNSEKIIYKKKKKKITQKNKKTIQPKKNKSLSKKKKIESSINFFQNSKNAFDQYIMNTIGCDQNISKNEKIKKNRSSIKNNFKKFKSKPKIKNNEILLINEKSSKSKNQKKKNNLKINKSSFEKKDQPIQKIKNKSLKKQKKQKDSKIRNKQIKKEKEISVNQLSKRFEKNKKNIEIKIDSITSFKNIDSKKTLDLINPKKNFSKNLNPDIEKPHNNLKKEEILSSKANDSNLSPKKKKTFEQQNQIVQNSVKKFEESILMSSHKSEMTSKFSKNENDTRRIDPSQNYFLDFKRLKLIHPIDIDKYSKDQLSKIENVKQFSKQVIEDNLNLVSYFTSTIECKFKNKIIQRF